MTIGNGGEPGGPGPGAYTVNKFGRNPEVDTATTPEDIWSGGGLYPFIDPAAPVELEVLAVGAGAANDTLLGSGARTVDIELLDINGLTVIVPIDMDGVTPVAIPGGPFTAHNRSEVMTAGATGANESVITIRAAGAGTTYGLIDFNAALGGGAGQTLQGVFTVPSNKEGKIVRHWARLAKAPITTAELRIVTKPPGGAWLTKETFPISSTLPHETEYPEGGGIAVSPGTQVRIEVFVVGANDAVISAGYDINLEDAA